jgi:hypothetical protein
MKWKRSRKAQQESKNKDKESNEEKRERSSNTSNQSSSSFKTGNSEKVAANLTPNNFLFPKNVEINSNHSQHPVIPHPRHHMPGSSKDVMQNSAEECYATNHLLNRTHQPNGFTENEAIWRVV